MLRKMKNHLLETIKNLLDYEYVNSDVIDYYITIYVLI
ncbi:hypothetical protein CDFC105_62250 [Clostridioides difficile]|nr:hypothetical protein CDFC105_62250 [Clostridioides difficile]